MPLFSRKKLQKMRPSTFNNLKDFRVKNCSGGNDEGADGKLSTKHQLTSHNLPPCPGGIYVTFLRYC